jgi:hypothetical protein
MAEPAVSGAVEAGGVGTVEMSVLFNGEPQGSPLRFDIP